MSTVFQTTATAAAALEFSLNTNPDPIRVSPTTGDVERADLVIVASRRESKAIECNKITVTIPTGPNSPDLALDLTGIDPQISLKDWTATTDATAKTITFAPTSGHATISRDEGVTIQLMGLRINRQVGSAPLLIRVYSREAGNNGAFQPDLTTLEIGKFPANFYLRNLKADPLIIDNGDKVDLTWEAGGVSSLRLLYDTADINVLGQSKYSLSEGKVTNTTVFYLRATVQIGNNTVERILSTTVAVRIPDLEVGNLFIRGGISNLRYSVNTSEPWTQSRVDGNFFGDSTPTLFTYNNQLHCVSSNFASQSGAPRWATLDRDTWREVPTDLPPGAAESDFVEFNNTLYCIYRTPDNAMYQTSRALGQLAWSAPALITATSWTTTHKPALAASSSGMTCLFRSPTGGILFATYKPESSSWGNAGTTLMKSTHAPAVATGLAEPYWAYRAENGEIRVGLLKLLGAPPVAIPGVRSSDGPALVAHQGGLCCAYQGEDGNLQYTTRLFDSWTPPTDISPLPAATAPALASFDGQLHAVYR